MRTNGPEIRTAANGFEAGRRHESEPGSHAAQNGSQQAPQNGSRPTDVGSAPREAQAGEIRTRISDGIVNLLRQSYGRGPEQAKTYYADDLVVCVLRGGFTRVEQMLLEAGRRDTVLAQRHAFQEVIADRFKELVQEVTGREVIGFVSGNHQSPDFLCEVFLLGAAAGAGAGHALSDGRT
ncbi:MAG: Na-translocating system protein MpsC family protein [Solirubrobacteraceae bacterium]